MGEDAGCPLCRAPAAKLLSRPSALVVDEAEARRIAARHPDAYAERLKHNRELSRELREQALDLPFISFDLTRSRLHSISSRSRHDPSRGQLEALKRERRCALPAIVGFSGVAENARLVAAAPSIGDDATPFRSFFWFSRTEHLNALAHALASAERRVLVLPTANAARGARCRLAALPEAHPLGGLSAYRALQELVRRRAARRGVAFVLEVQRGHLELDEPVWVDEERLCVPMGSVLLPDALRERSRVAGARQSASQPAPAPASSSSGSHPVEPLGEP